MTTDLYKRLRVVDYSRIGAFSSGMPGQCPLSSLCMAECEMILLKTGKFLRKEYRKEWVFTHLGVETRRRFMPHLGKYCSVENGGIITWLVLLV